MRLFVPLLMGLFVLPALGQGSRYDNFNVTSAASAPFGSQSTLYTLPYSKVTVCAYPDDGASPCANTVQLYGDAGLSQPIDNPITADVHGRFGFWLQPGNYSYSIVTASGTFLGTFAFTLGGAPSGTQASSIRVQSYGALCDWNGTSGTDDTGAFQAAVDAAHAKYLATRAPTSVSVEASCVVNGVVAIGSGVVLKGPGLLTIQTQTGGTLLFQNADNSGVEGLTLNVTATSIGNNANVAAISWRNTSSDTAAHSHWFARNNTITGNASWGILVDAYQGGAGSSLSDIDISGNAIASPTVGTNADGIHVAGAATNVTVRGNRVTNRGDAAIAVTAENGVAAPQNVIVEGNVLTNDLVGLDCSGCQNTTWAHNYVNSSNSFGGASDPAARAIFYAGTEPLNVKFIGNYLVNTSSTEFAAKVDQRGGGTAPVNIEFTGNTVGPTGLDLYANTVTVADNTFQPGSVLAVLADATITARNVAIGQNHWQGAGTFLANSNPGYYANNSLMAQVAPAGITYTTSSPNNVPAMSLIPNTGSTALTISKPLMGTNGKAVDIAADGTSGKALVIQNNALNKNYAEYDETSGLSWDVTGSTTNYIANSGLVCLSNGSHCPISTYTPDGTLVPGTHIVSGTATMTSGTAAVTFSGLAAFTSPTSYACTANDTTAANGVRFTAISGTTANFIGTSGDSVSFVCAGI